MSDGGSSTGPPPPRLTLGSRLRTASFQKGEEYETMLAMRWVIFACAIFAVAPCVWAGDDGVPSPGDEKAFTAITTVMLSVIFLWMCVFFSFIRRKYFGPKRKKRRTKEARESM